MLKVFKSISDLKKVFPNEQACIDHLTELRWEEEIISPFDKTSIIYICKNNRFKCRNTGKYFTVKTGTIFESTKIPLQEWFLAIYLFTSHKRGISSYQLANDIGVTQKTAWFMLSRIRYAMEHESFVKSMEGTIEVDETFIGGKNKNRHWDKKVKNSQGRSFKDKIPVLGLLENEESYTIEREHKIIKGKTVKEKVIIKPNRLFCKVVKDTKQSTLESIINQVINKDSKVITDEWKAYTNLYKNYNHRIVDHHRSEYVNSFGDTTNRIENTWSILKRMYIGTYYHISKKHLESYIKEFVFRYNFRTKKSDERFNLFINSTYNKRITYKQLINGSN